MQQEADGRVATRNLALGTVAFAVAFTAWGLISPLGRRFEDDLGLSSTETSILLAGVATTLGFGILVYRRFANARVRATTSRSDLVLYPLLGLAIVTGMVATIWGTAIDEYAYRESVSPWFRSIFAFDPNATLMVGAPFVFQLHAVVAWLLFLVWPFTRLVHAWSIPLGYLLRRSHVLYRSRTPKAALARERSRP